MGNTQRHQGPVGIIGPFQLASFREARQASCIILDRALMMVQGRWRRGCRARRGVLSCRRGSERMLSGGVSLASGQEMELVLGDRGTEYLSGMEARWVVDTVSLVLGLDPKRPATYLGHSIVPFGDSGCGSPLSPFVSTPFPSSTLSIRRSKATCLSYQVILALPTSTGFQYPAVSTSVPFRVFHVFQNSAAQWSWGLPPGELRGDDWRLSELDCTLPWCGPQSRIFHLSLGKPRPPC